ETPGHEDRSLTHRPISRSSPASEDSISPSMLWDSGASDRSSGTSPAPESSSDGGPTYRDGETLLPTPKAQEAAWTPAADHRPGHRAYNAKGYHKTWGVQQVVAVLTSSAEGSPVSQSQPLAQGKPRATPGGSGPSSPASFAMLDLDGSWLRTYRDSSVQGSLLGPPLRRFSGTWPRQGSMRGGRVLEHPTSERPSDASAHSFLLATPNPIDGVGVTRPY